MGSMQLGRRIIVAVTLSFSALLAATSVATAETGSGDEELRSEEVGVISITVKDYAADGRLVDTHTISRKFGQGGVSVLEYFNETLPAPEDPVGCRDINTFVWYGLAEIAPYYRLESYVDFCYDRPAGSVTSHSTSWELTEHDGVSNVHDPTEVVGPYVWEGGPWNSGYETEREWHVERTEPFMGSTWHYYPDLNIYVHGDGSVYGSGNTL